MCIYCGTTNYRKIYEKHHGSIPKDSEGRTYDIHHKDGNHSNNHPDNLSAVSILEHYEIHYSQEDWNACLAIAHRVRLPAAERSLLAQKNNAVRIFSGTHQFKNSEWQRQNQYKRVNLGTHPFKGGEIQSKTAKN